MVDAGDMLHIVEHLGDVVAHDDDGALLVDLLQHLVHLLLESAVDVGVRLIEYHDIGLGDDGTGEEHSLQLSSAQGSDMSVLEVGELHTLQCVKHLLVLCLRISGKEFLALAQTREHDLIDGNRKLLVESIILREVSHGNLLYLLQMLVLICLSLLFLVLTSLSLLFLVLTSLSLAFLLLEESNGSARRLHQSEDETDERSLATTVRSDDA